MRMTGTHLALFGVMMVLLTTIPIGRLFCDLILTIQVSHLVIQLDLPLTTLAEIAGI